MSHVAQTSDEQAFQDPETIRIKRDRSLASEFLQLGGNTKAMQQLRKNHPGIHRRTIYRAVKRQLEWAQTDLGETAKKEEAPAEFDTPGPSTSEA